MSLGAANEPLEISHGNMRRIPWKVDMYTDSEVKVWIFWGTLPRLRNNLHGFCQILSSATRQISYKTIQHHDVQEGT